MSNSRSDTRRGGRRRHGLLGAAVLMGLLGSGGFIWQGTNAAFTASTVNPTNSWSVGSIALVDDDSNAAMFTVPKMKPNDTGNKCIKVDFTGNLNSAIKIFAGTKSDPDNIAQYIDLKIEEGTGGTYANCTGFGSATTVFDDKLSVFNTTKLDHATGVSTWTTAVNATKTYKFTWTLNNATPNAAQGKTASTTFTWEAQTT